MARFNIVTSAVVARRTGGGGDLGDERLPATPSSSFIVHMSHVVLPADWECDALCQERPYCSKLGTGAEVLFLELLTVLALLSV